MASAFYVNDDPTSAMLSQSGLSAFDAVNCVDDNIETNAWHTDSATAGAYLLVNLGADNAKAYTKTRIYSTGSNAGNYSVQYSDNGIDWTNAATQLNPNVEGWNRKTWASVGAHRYWRYYLTNTPGSGSWLRELEFYTSVTNLYGENSILIYNAADSLLAVFDQEYISGALDLEENQDAIKDPWIERKLNGSCTLTFKVPATSDKVQYLTDENFIYAAGRKFVIIDPQGEGLKLVRVNGQLWMEVFARESWEELKYQHKTLCSDTTQEPVKDLDVVITRSGTTAGGYAAGSAGSALSHLLPTEWTLNSAGVTGTHDLKTSQESILGNIENIRDLWGGYHIWDSLAQALDHQPESWSVDSGYEIRLAKNLKGLTKGYSFDFVTKLWVYGQNDVDILDVNILNSGTCAGGGVNTITLAVGASSVNEAYTGGWVYLTGGPGSGEYKRIKSYDGSTRVATLESNWTTQPVSGSTTYELKARFLLNFGHRSVIRSDIWRNQDITDPTELKIRAQEIHTKVAYPRYWYKVEHVDLRAISDYSHESFSVGQLIDIIDETLGIAISVRVTRHKYNVFRTWLCDLDLGDTVFELKQILAGLEKQKRVNYRQARTSGTVIIADGSTTRNTRRADFIVPPGSTSSQSAINTTINSLGPSGGNVILLYGIFIVNGGIIAPDNITVEGQGNSTIVRLAAGNYTSRFSLISNRDRATTGNVNIVIKNIKFDGNKDNVTAGPDVPIFGIDLEKAYYCTARNNICVNFEASGMRITNSHDCIISGNICNDNIENGIFMFTSTYGCTISGNTCKGNGLNGISLEGIDNCTISNNICSNSLQHGIFANIAVIKTTISNNICKNNSFSGIAIQGGSNYNAVSSNICQGNGLHGIENYLSNNNTISGNECLENSQTTDNWYSNILLETSDYNNVQNNTCRIGSLTNRPRHGINIYNSTCDGNVVTNNDLITSGVTGSLNDAGTGTITTAGNRL